MVTTDPARPRLVRRRGVGRRLVLVELVGIPTLLVILTVATGIGPVGIAPGRVLATVANLLGFGGEITAQERAVVGAIRLPRILVAALVGCALGVAGTAMQGTFRNPLAEPGVIGVSAGGALGAVLAIYLGLDNLTAWTLPGLAFVTALATVALVFGAAKLARGSSPGATMLLVGIAINAFVGALIAVMVATAPREEDLRSIMFWLQGGLDARTWHHVQLAALPILLGSVGLLAFGRDLNLMALGDDQSRSTGLNVRRSRALILILAALVTASAVAVSGAIAFVGLVVPHILRLILGPDHRVLMPAAALGGAVLLVVADTVARMAFNPVSLQVGIVTALIGAPFLLVTILRGQVR